MELAKQRKKDIAKQTWQTFTRISRSTRNTQGKDGKKLLAIKNILN